MDARRKWHIFKCRIKEIYQPQILAILFFKNKGKFKTFSDEGKVGECDINRLPLKND